MHGTFSCVAYFISYRLPPISIPGLNHFDQWSAPMAGEVANKSSMTSIITMTLQCILSIKFFLIKSHHRE